MNANQTLKGRHLAQITAVAAKTRKETGDDGTKQEQHYYAVTLESADIDYDSLSAWHPAAGATLLNIQPIPFKSVDFGEVTQYNMSMDFFSEVEERGELLDEAEAHFDKLEILNMTVKVKDNIPVFVFKMAFPMLAGVSYNFLVKAVKKKISFEMK